MKHICVFCGSSAGDNVLYREAAQELANQLLNKKHGLVYGGAHVGLMGEIANHILKNNGTVIGVIPRSLEEREVAHKELTELFVVENMHQRKMKMHELSDGFIAMPGGLGTIEEIFEMITWAQLGFHNKPCAFLNINGYYDKLLSFLDNCVSEGFLEKEYRDMIIVDENPEVVLTKMEQYTPPTLDKAKVALSK